MMAARPDSCALRKGTRMVDATEHAAHADAAAGLVNYTQLIYALHACAVLTGVFTSATIAGRFLFGLPSIVAVILNYARRSEARGTWLESHFDWQIRTFWFALLWSVIGIPLCFVVVGIPILLADGVWVIYRIVKGWLRLSENKPMYQAPAAGP